MKLRQASNHCKSILEATKLAYTDIHKSLSLSRNLVAMTFKELLIMFSTKVNLLYLLYLNLVSVIFCYFHKKNVFLGYFKITTLKKKLAYS